MGESVPTPEKSKCQYDDVKPGMKRSTWLTKKRSFGVRLFLI